MNIPEGFILEGQQAGSIPDGFVLDQPSTWQDIKSLAPDLPLYAGAALGGLPGDIASLVGLGGKKYSPPTSEALRIQAAEVMGTPLYEPQTRTGKFAKAIGENVIGALLPGGLAARAVGMVAPAVGGEAARQATEGTVAEPYAQLAGALGGGLAGARLTAGGAAARQARALEQQARVAPAELMAAGAAGKRAAETSGAVIDPAAALNFVTQARDQLTRSSKPRSLASGVHSAIDELEASASQAAMAGRPLSANDMVAFRGVLTEFGKVPSTNSAAAGMAKSAFDDWLARTSPTLADQVREYTANFRGGFLGTEIASPANRATLGAQATYSGMNVENRIRSALSTRLAKEEERAMLGRRQNFTPETQQLMRGVVEGTPGANRARAAGNFLGGGGGALASVYSLTGALGALGTGNPMPLLLAAAPIAGAGIKGAANRRTLAAADQVAQSAMAMAPLAQARAAQFQAQIAAARRAIQTSKMSAAQRAVMLQAIDKLARSPSMGAVSRAEDQQ